MEMKIERWFRAPYGMPNGVQATADGIRVVDQVTDRVALLGVSEADEYGMLRLRSEVSTESSNTSGLAWGDGSLWLAANGSAEKWRAPRNTDADSGEILRVDPKTGETQGRWPLPGGGGTHGLEYDAFEPGTLWLTTLKSQTLTQVRISDWSIQRVFSLPYGRAHGVVACGRTRVGCTHVRAGDRETGRAIRDCSGRDQGPGVATRATWAFQVRRWISLLRRDLGMGGENRRGRLTARRERTRKRQERRL